MRRRASHHVRVLLLVGLLPALALVVGACGDVAIAPEATPVVGSGDVISEDRTAGPVERISVAAAIDVVVQVGTPGSVTLTAQPDILPLVSTEVRDGQLIVHVPRPGYTTTMPVQLTVITPKVTAVTLSGGARGLIEMSGGSLALDLSGGASIEGVGSLDTLHLTASSDADVVFARMVVDACTLAMSGGSAAELDVTSRLDGEVSGGATVTLTRPVPTMTVQTTSGGSVQGG